MRESEKTPERSHMNQIKCPKCGEVFTVDESGYADIVKQVRDKEFRREMERQAETLEETAKARQEAALEKLRAEEAAGLAGRTARCRETARRREGEAGGGRPRAEAGSTGRPGRCAETARRAGSRSSGS